MGCKDRKEKLLCHFDGFADTPGEILLSPLAFARDEMPWLVSWHSLCFGARKFGFQTVGEQNSRRTNRGPRVSPGSTAFQRRPCRLSRHRSACRAYGLSCARPWRRGGGRGRQRQRILLFLFSLRFASRALLQQYRLTAGVIIHAPGIGQKTVGRPYPTFPRRGERLAARRFRAHHHASAQT